MQCMHIDQYRSASDGWTWSPISISFTLALQESVESSSTHSSAATALEVDGHEDSSSPGPSEAGSQGEFPDLDLKELDWLDLCQGQITGHESMFRTFGQACHEAKTHHKKASFGGHSKSGSEIDNAETQLQTVDTLPSPEVPKGKNKIDEAHGLKKQDTKQAAGAKDKKDTVNPEDLKSDDEATKTHLKARWCERL